MALFKILRGLKSKLPSTKTDGYCWYTTDDSMFYIDYKDDSGVLQRKALNAKDSQTVSGASLSVSLDSSDTQIPTSKAVLSALSGKANSSHTHSSYVNQNAFSNIAVGSSTISANTTTDTLTLVAGTNVTLTPDITNEKVTITAKDTVYTHPSYTEKSSGLYKVTVDKTGHVSATTDVTKSDITALGIPSTNTTYSTGTSSTAGLTKLYTGTGTATDGTMTQNAINTSLGSKAPTSHASTATTYGVSSASNYGHVMASSTTPKANGTAATGSETDKFARGDHVHPLQTSVSGNAGTATKLATSRTISLTGDVTGSGSFDGSANLSITTTVADDSHNHVISNVDGLQTALDAKQATITGGATTIASSNLTASRALVSNSSGKVAVSAVTSTELGYLDGVTSNIQTQLNKKANSTHTHASSDITLTDTVTGTKYQLCMTNGKLNVVQI